MGGAAGKDAASGGLCCTTRDPTTGSIAHSGGHCCTVRLREGVSTGPPLRKEEGCGSSAWGGALGSSADEGGRGDSAASCGNSGADRAVALKEATADSRESGDRRFRFDPFCNLECASDRSAAGCSSSAFRQVLSGDKPLKRKLVNLQALSEEEEQVSGALGLLAQRSKEDLSSTSLKLTAEIPVPEVDSVVKLKAGQASTSLLQQGSSSSISDWVKPLLQTEDALKGVPASLVAEDSKEVYGLILAECKRIAEVRLHAVREERDRLVGEVEALEEFITACFEDMDIEGTGEITLQRFVEFVCPPCDENHLTLTIGPEEAEHCFTQMAGGAKVLSYTQFKEEVTTACLRVLHRNISLKHSLKKRFRDTWF